VRIFKLYAEGRGGQVRIAKALNAEHVPNPSHGKRGTGSWSPGAVRNILLNERYIGIVEHGRIIRKKATDPITGKLKRVARKAEAHEVIRMEMPELRIVPAHLWNAVQARFAEQAGLAARNGNPFRTGAPRHLLSGLGRCENCGGPITVTSTKGRSGTRLQSYSCAWAKKRGATVCTIGIHQPRTVVETAVIKHLLDHVLTTQVMEKIVARVVELARTDSNDGPVSVEQLEGDLATLRAEQKRCARLLAKLEDAGELEAEYSARTTKIRALEASIAAAKAAPATARLTLDTLGGEIAATFDRLRHGLVGAPEDARAALRSLFSRLSFEKDGPKWKIAGTPQLEMPATPSICDPTVSSRKVRNYSMQIHYITPRRPAMRRDRGMLQR
jgi:hypothetical protein